MRNAGLVLIAGESGARRNQVLMNYMIRIMENYAAGRISRKDYRDSVTILVETLAKRVG